MWVRVKSLVEAEEGPRRLEAVAGHLQLALCVHILDQELWINRRRVLNCSRSDLIDGSSGEL